MISPLERPPANKELSEECFAKWSSPESSSRLFSTPKKLQGRVWARGATSQSEKKSVEDRFVGEHFPCR